jgi:ELWxxDGT repeat protein
MRILSLCVSILTICSLTSRHPAQVPELVKDVNTTPKSGPSSNPDSFVKAGGFIFCRAFTPEFGNELYRTGLTPGSTVLLKDIMPGPKSSSIFNMTAVGSLCFFTADDGVHGTELWVSDGSPAGTHLVLDILTGFVQVGTKRVPASGRPSGLVAFDGQIYFAAGDGGIFAAAPGRELWSSNGTAAGTRMFDLLRAPFGKSSSPRELTVAGDTLYFRTSGTSRRVFGYELWRFPKGSQPGMVKDGWREFGNNAKDPDGFPTDLTAVGNLVFFTATSDQGGRQLWVSNGTGSGGTRVLKTFRSKAGKPHGQVRNLTARGNTLFFTAPALPDFANQDIELWKSDGTEAGTVMAADIRPGTDGCHPESLTVVGNTVFFTALKAGRNLWKSDGTGPGTIQIENNTTFNSVQWFLAGSGGQLYYVQRSSSGRGGVLRKTVGSIGGAVVVSSFLDLILGAPVDIGGGRVILAASRLHFGREPVVTDGTEAGTFTVADINAIPNTESARVTEIVDVMGTTYFVAREDATGTELYKSDGTSAGTRLVKDLTPGPVSSRPRELTHLDGTLFFVAISGPSGSEIRGLWRSDRSGTVPVKSWPGRGNTNNLTVVGGTLFFLNTDAGTGHELWKSDGTTAGTVLVKDIARGFVSSGGQNLAAVGNRLFLSATDGSNGNELWVSDGTDTGTRMVKDILPGRSGSGPGGLIDRDGTVFFVAFDGSTNGLWKSDGTSSGTQLLKSFVRISRADLAVVGDTVFFAADDGVSGTELWKTDGTPAGTVLVEDLTPGAQGVSPSALMAFNGKVLYSAFVSAGSGLFIHDGSSNGSVKLMANSGIVRNALAVGTRHVWFSVLTKQEGAELWRTDGTVAGTQLMHDIRKGQFGSNPTDLALSHGRLMFSADNGVFGRELWSVDPGATAQKVGRGSVVPGRNPRLRASDPVTGQTMTMTAEGGMPGGSGLLVIGLSSPTVQSLAGLRIYFDLQAPFFSLPMQLDGNGTATLGVSIPANLTGLATVQSAFLATNAPQGIDVTNGVILSFGR